MIVKKDRVIGNKNGLNILVMAGVHGNETHAVASVYDLYQTADLLKFADRINTITYIFNINEYGLEQDTRDNNYKKLGTKNCNRLFSNEYKTPDEIKEYIENLPLTYNLVLDVHNSPKCIPCVLVDYDENTYRLLSNLKGAELIPLVRCTQIGTVKRYFNRLGWTAYTVELPDMGVNGDIKESTRLLLQFIETVSDNMFNNKFTNIEVNQDMVTQNLFTKTPNGIIRYTRENVLGEYKKGEFICDVYDMDKGTIEIIKAPFDGILYDVDENIYSYSGKPFGIYGRKIEY